VCVWCGPRVCGGDFDESRLTSHNARRTHARRTARSHESQVCVFCCVCVCVACWRVANPEFVKLDSECSSLSTSFTHQHVYILTNINRYSASHNEKCARPFPCTITGDTAAKTGGDLHQPPQPKQKQRDENHCPEPQHNWHHCWAERERSTLKRTAARTCPTASTAAATICT
jgi:hypothetical protein